MSAETVEGFLVDLQGLGYVILPYPPPPRLDDSVIYSADFRVFPPFAGGEPAAVYHRDTMRKCWHLELA